MSSKGGRGHGSGGKRRGGAHEEEHENHERWAVSYADMMTVLMALFLVLFAMSSIQQEKYIALKNSLAAGFGGKEVVATGAGDKVLESSGVEPNPVGLETGGEIADPSEVGGASSGEGGDAERAAAVAAATAEAAKLTDAQERIAEALRAQGLEDRVRFTITERGLVVAVVADDVFFADASAVIQPTGLRVVDAVAPVLGAMSEDVAVEGHANHLVVSTAQYPTNWELSSARATSVLRRLVTSGVPGERVTAVAYGDTHPLFPRDDPRAIEGNRRVDVVVESDQPSGVRELVPAIASGEAPAVAPAAPVEPAVAPAAAPADDH